MTLYSETKIKERIHENDLDIAMFIAQIKSLGSDIVDRCENFDAREALGSRRNISELERNYEQLRLCINLKQNLLGKLQHDDTV